MTSTYATCGDCGRTMQPGGSCTITHVQSKGGEIFKRVLAGEGDDWSKTTCHDCNVAAGKPHHPGCDTERCPKCGGQMLGCWGDPDDPELLALFAENPTLAWNVCGWVSLLERA